MLNVKQGNYWNIWKKHNLKMKKTTHTKQEHTYVKNLKRQTEDKGFLIEIKTTCG